MPFYEYECPSCKYYAEVLQKITDKPLKKCPSCGKAGFKKLVSAPVFRLKGSGWYETDFKSEGDNKRNLAGAEHEAPAADAKAAADAKPGADAKGEGKGDAKGEGKGDAKSEGKSEGKSEAKSEVEGGAESKQANEGKGGKQDKASGRGAGTKSSRGASRSTARRPAGRAATKKKPARGGKRR